MDAVATKIARFNVHPVCESAFCRCVLLWAGLRGGRLRLVSYLNAHNVNLAFEDEEYRDILRRADMLYADGMGVVWGWRLVGQALPCRVNAGDLILDFCRGAAEQGLSLYLLGSAPGVAEAAARRWQAEAPGLKIAGARDGFFRPEDEDAVAEEIRRAHPDLLLVGMGVPRQEKWAARWKDRLGVPVVWCVGALFEYSGGRRARAPVWMRRCGMEWAWRLALEPRRLWKRYLVGNIRFLRNLMRVRAAAKRRGPDGEDVDRNS
ncbi:MAG: WecB/TagA/CpsF family glycosyltransferase [Candidatus Sumerlaeota bacterium]|nr:WecB/TagA/CpsF family glycosyltransferase [Candidatus Sumerlaeota bacterium]